MNEMGRIRREIVGAYDEWRELGPIDKALFSKMEMYWVFKVLDVVNPGYMYRSKLVGSMAEAAVIVRQCAEASRKKRLWKNRAYPWRLFRFKGER